MQGKTIVLTGASSGIGKQTTLELARRGAHVVMACRDLEKARSAQREIEADAGFSGRLELREIDLASFDSIRAFADGANAELDRIDVLVNNAGVFPQKAATTADGFEMQFGANHLGSFLLTNLLLDKLKASAPARVVHLTSMLHKRGAIDFESFRGEKPYKASVAYNQSKLGNLLFSNELARRLEGTDVTSNAVHPGAIATDIVRDMPWIARKAVGFMFKGVDEGAQGPLMLTCDAELDGKTGRYFMETTEKRPSDAALDEALAKRLWEESARLTGLSA